MGRLNELVDFANVMCKIAFITYAWLTMIRINSYIKEHEKDGKMG